MKKNNFSITRAVFLGISLALPLSVLLFVSPSIQPRGQQGCFGGQAPNEALSGALQSVFRIGLQGHHFGTGFAISHPDTREVLYVTAAHTVGGLQNIDVTDYRGRFLGSHRVVGNVQVTPVEGSGGALLGDMVFLVREGEENPLPGLQISPLRPSPSLFVRFLSPGGPDIGTSGAPVLDNEGRFMGMVTHSNSMAFPRTYLIGYGGSPIQSSIPRTGWGFADTFFNLFPATTRISEGEAWIPAYPWGHCVLSRGIWASYSSDMQEAANRIHRFIVP